MNLGAYASTSEVSDADSTDDKDIGERAAKRKKGSDLETDKKKKKKKKKEKKNKKKNKKRQKAGEEESAVTGEGASGTEGSEGTEGVASVLPSAAQLFSSAAKPEFISSHEERQQSKRQELEAENMLLLKENERMEKIKAERQKHAWVWRGARKRGRRGR